MTLIEWLLPEFVLEYSANANVKNVFQLGWIVEGGLFVQYC